MKEREQRGKDKGKRWEKGELKGGCHIETNSRTFHRLQDCYINLEGNNFLEALVIAESCRARTMGEMMLKQNQWALNHYIKQLFMPMNTLMSAQLISSLLNTAVLSITDIVGTWRRGCPAGLRAGGRRWCRSGCPCDQREGGVMDDWGTLIVPAAVGYHSNARNEPYK